MTANERFEKAWDSFLVYLNRVLSWKKLTGYKST